MMGFRGDVVPIMTERKGGTIRLEAREFSRSGYMGPRVWVKAAQRQPQKRDVLRRGTVCAGGYALSGPTGDIVLGQLVAWLLENRLRGVKLDQVAQPKEPRPVGHTPGLLHAVGRGPVSGLMN